MSHKKIDAVMNIVAAISCSVILVLLTPMTYEIYNSVTEMEMPFYWWDKASFIFGPVFLFGAIICLGYKGIRDLKSEANPQSDSN